MFADIFIVSINFRIQQSNGQCIRYGGQHIPNGNELIFDVYKEISAASLKSYINVQLLYMISKVTEEGIYINKKNILK